MRILPKSYRVDTSHGAIAVDEVGRGRTTVVFIHGNSSCRKIFRHQMMGALLYRCRLIAFDLPGHGDSDDALVPERTYSRPGLADAAIELLKALGIDKAILVGWSLGGHIAIDMAARYPGLGGLMISGTPPTGHDEIGRGFKPSSHLALARKRELSEAEVLKFAIGMAGEPVAPALWEAIVRADGRGRENLFRGREAGLGVDQRQVVENLPVPLAVVNGAEDPFIDLDFLDEVAYANLWSGRCHRLPGQGHAAFWTAPHLFNPLLERFVRDLEELGPRLCEAQPVSRIPR